MNDAELLNRLRAANPIPRGPRLDSRELELLDARIATQEWTMTTSAPPKRATETTPEPAHRWRPGLALAVGMLAALVTIGVPAFLFFQSGEPTDQVIPPAVDVETVIETHLGTGCANSVTVAPNGTVWVLGAGSLHRYDGSGWTDVAPPPGRELPECAMAAAATADGLWLADIEGALLLTSGTWQEFANPLDGHAETGCPADDPCGFYDLATTVDGAVYAAGGGMLFHFDGTAFVLAQVGADSVEAGPDGSLWIDGGPAIMRLEDGEWLAIPSPDLDVYNVVGIEPAGAAWLSPMNALVQDGYEPPEAEELVRFDGEQFLAYSIRHVSDAVATDDGVWLGVQRRMPWEYHAHEPDPNPGLYRLIDGSWYHITTADGLADNEVTSLAAAPDGSLWVGTRQGVNRIVPGTQPIGAQVDITTRSVIPEDMPPMTTAPPVPDLVEGFYAALAALAPAGDTDWPSAADVLALFESNSVDLRSLTGLEPGDLVPGPAGDLLGGDTVSADTFLDGERPLLILYWATTEPMLDPGGDVSSLANLYAFEQAYQWWPTDLQFVSVVVHEGPLETRAVMEGHGFTFPVVRNPAHVPATDPELFPMWILLDTEGRFVDGFSAFEPIRAEGSPIDRLPVGYLLEDLELRPNG